MTNQGFQKFEADGLPVLPRAWAPLTDEEQAAVLSACERCDNGLLMRLASHDEPSEEYRVYRLSTDEWPNVVVVSRARLVQPPGYGSPVVRNTEFLGLAQTAEEGIRIAVGIYHAETR
jgi:hypothetical protein